MTPRTIRLRPLTSAKFDVIAAHFRWTLAETADVLADDFMASRGLSLPPETPDAPVDQEASESQSGQQQADRPASSPSAPPAPAASLPASTEPTLDTSDADAIPSDEPPVIGKPPARRKGAA